MSLAEEILAAAARVSHTSKLIYVGGGGGGGTKAVDHLQNND